jgi:hypothetical protein
LCANLAYKTQENTRNSHATINTQNLEATSGASSAARGSTGTLAGHGKGEECRDMRRDPTRGRSSLSIVRCGGLPTQDGVRVSDMDGERNLSAPRGEQLAHMHPFRSGCVLGQLVQKAVAWPPRGPNSVTAKGMTRMSGRFLTRPSTSRAWSSQHAGERLHEMGG